jgi:hypothetical protein
MLSVSIPDDLAEAAKKFGLAPSDLLEDAIRQAIAEKERETALATEGMELLTLTVTPDHGPDYEVEFIGRWLSEPRGTGATDYGVAITARGNMVHWFRHREAIGGGFQVYRSVNEIEGAGGIGRGTLTDAVRRALGEKIRLDI